MKHATNEQHAKLVASLGRAVEAVHAFSRNLTDAQKAEVKTEVLQWGNASKQLLDAYNRIGYNA